jgi:hypothetical protein
MVKGKFTIVEMGGDVRCVMRDEVLSCGSVVGWLKAENWSTGVVECCRTGDRPDFRRFEADTNELPGARRLAHPVAAVKPGGQPEIRKMNRRRWLAAALVSAPLLALGDAKWIEPGWLKIRRLRIGPGKPTHRLAHFTDVHRKGDRRNLQSVVSEINGLSPDLVCFTGDLVDERKGLAEALNLLAGRRPG